jgi:hypothetical protein
MPCYKNIVYGPSASDANPNTTLNAIIPFTGKPKLLCKTKYADDQVTPMYYEYVLTVDTLIYEANRVLATVEDEVTRLRNILATPGLQLKIYPVGLGIFPVVNGTAVVAGFTNTPDLTGGPFPSGVSVEPVASNNAIHVQFEMTFGITHCSPFFGRQLVQFNSELDVQVDDDGSVVFTVLATYQARQPIASISSLTPFTNNLTATAGKVFQGMTRKKRASFSRDRRTVHLEVEYSEIKSDSPFHPYVKNVEIEDEMSSSLVEDDYMKGAAFYTWDRNISGTITLPPRIPKIWAWYVFQSILAERFKGMALLNKVPGVGALAEPTVQEAAGPAGHKAKAWWLLTRIRFTARPYTRSMSFEVGYIVCCDLVDLLKGEANLFSSVRSGAVVGGGGAITLTKATNTTTGAANTSYVSEDKSTEWLLWESYNNINVGGWNGYETNGPVVFAQCDISGGVGPPNPEKVGATLDRAGTNEQDPAILATSTEDVRYVYRGGDSFNLSKTWLKYQNRFEFVEDSATDHVSYLQQTPITAYQADPASSVTNESTAFNLNPRSDIPEAGGTLPETLTFGTPTYKIRMVGWAIRVGAKVALPAMLQVGSKAVTRVGKARYTHETLAVGSDLRQTGSPSTVINRQPVYLAMWDVMYAVDDTLKTTSAADLLANVITSGEPAHYI